MTAPSQCLHLTATTALTCGCTGIQVHAFRGKPMRLHLTGTGIWVNAADMDLIPEVRDVMGCIPGHYWWDAYVAPNPWPAGSQDDARIPATRVEDVTLVCGCTREDGSTGNPVKQRRVLTPDMIAVQQKAPNPYVVLKE